MSEEKENKQEEKPTPVDTGEGIQPKTSSLIEQTNEAAKRAEAALQGIKAENDRREELIMEQRLSGTAEAGVKAPEKKPLTDTEYAEALQRGEVNPLKEDGLV